MTTQPDLSIIIPCLNEEENISPLVERLLAALEGIPCELILVDDGSEDRTWDRIQEQGRIHPEVTGTRHAHNQGIAAGWESGFKLVRSDRIAIMDADLQYRPEDLVTLYEEHGRDEVDIVQGWRHTRKNPKGLRALVSRVLGAILGFLFSTDLNDIKSGFAVFSRRAFEASLTRRLRYRSFQTFIFINALSRGLTIREVPVAFDRRHAGESFIRNPFQRALKVSPDFVKAFMEFRLREIIATIRTNKRQLFSASLVTIILLAILLRYIDGEQFLETFRSSHMEYIAVGLGLLILTYLVRVMRIQRAMPDRRLPWSALFGVTALHNFLRNIVPFRIGELSFIYLINKKAGCGLSRGALIFYVLTAADLISIILIASAGALLYFGVAQEQFGVMVVISLAICMVGVGMLFFSGHWIRLFGRLLDPIANGSRGRISTLASAVRRSVDRMGEAFDLLTRPVLLEILFYSAVIWVARFGVTYMIILAIDIPIQFHEVIIASAITILLATIPIQGVAGFGTFEAAYTIGYCAVGLTRGQAVEISLYSHIIFLVFLSTLALSGILVMRVVQAMSGRKIVTDGENGKETI